MQPIRYQSGADSVRTSCLHRRTEKDSTQPIGRLGFRLHLTSRQSSIFCAVSSLSTLSFTSIMITINTIVDQLYHHNENSNLVNLALSSISVGTTGPSSLCAAYCRPVSFDPTLPLQHFEALMCTDTSTRKPKLSFYITGCGVNIEKGRAYHFIPVVLSCDEVVQNRRDDANKLLQDLLIQECIKENTLSESKQKSILDKCSPNPCAVQENAAQTRVRDRTIQ